MGCVTAINQTAGYVLSDQVAIYDPFNQTAIYRLEVICPNINIHEHVHFVIPVGVIDGVNCEFVVPGRRFEVMFNGLNQLFTQTASGFVLSDPPRSGDYLWCEVIL